MLVSAGGDPRKNIAAAVTALARHRETDGGHLRAVVTGALTDPQAAALNDLASQIGLPRVLSVRGYVPDDELAGLYEAADLTCVTSLAEGSQSGCRIDRPRRARRRLRHCRSSPVVGGGAWLAPGTDIGALAEALGHVRRDRQVAVEHQRTVLGDKADPGRVVDRIAEALEGLLGDRRERRGGQRPYRSRPRLAVVSPFPPQRSGVAD